jgi:hypothetical protein
MSSLHLRSAFAVVLLAVLAGCVRYDESIEVDQNGKGAATIVMSRPKRGFLEKATFRATDFDERFGEKAMSKDLPPGVKLNWSQKEQDERIEITAVYTFDDINVLAGWAANSDNPLRGISVKRTSDTLEFTRQIKALEEEQLEAVKKYLPDTTLTFKLKGPGSLKTTNATRQDGSTAIWEYKAAELFQGGKEFKAQFFFGTPLWVYALIAFFVLDAIIVAVIVMKKKKAPAAA